MDRSLSMSITSMVPTANNSISSTPVVTPNSSISTRPQLLSSSSSTFINRNMKTHNYGTGNTIGPIKITVHPDDERNPLLPLSSKVLSTKTIVASTPTTTTTDPIPLPKYHTGNYYNQYSPVIPQHRLPTITTPVTMINQPPSFSTMLPKTDNNKFVFPSSSSDNLSSPSKATELLSSSLSSTVTLPLSSSLLSPFASSLPLVSMLPKSDPSINSSPSMEGSSIFTISTSAQGTLALPGSSRSSIGSSSSPQDFSTFSFSPQNRYHPLRSSHSYTSNTGARQHMSSVYVDPLPTTMSSSLSSTHTAAEIRASSSSATTKSTHVQQYNHNNNIINNPSSFVAILPSDVSLSSCNAEMNTNSLPSLLPLDDFSDDIYSSSSSSITISSASSVVPYTNYYDASVNNYNRCKTSLSSSLNPSIMFPVPTFLTPMASLLTTTKDGLPRTNNGRLTTTEPSVHRTTTLSKDNYPNNIVLQSLPLPSSSSSLSLSSNLSSCPPGIPKKSSVTTGRKKKRNTITDNHFPNSTVYTGNENLTVKRPNETLSCSVFSSSDSGNDTGLISTVNVSSSATAGTFPILITETHGKLNSVKDPSKGKKRSHKVPKSEVEGINNKENGLMSPDTDTTMVKSILHANDSAVGPVRTDEDQYTSSIVPLPITKKPKFTLTSSIQVTVNDEHATDTVPRTVYAKVVPSTNAIDSSGNENFSTLVIKDAFSNNHVPTSSLAVSENSVDSWLVPLPLLSLPSNSSVPVSSSSSSSSSSTVSSSSSSSITRIPSLLQIKEPTGSTLPLELVEQLGLNTGLFSGSAAGIAATNATLEANQAAINAAAVAAAMELLSSSSSSSSGTQPNFSPPPPETKTMDTVQSTVFSPIHSYSSNTSFSSTPVSGDLLAVSSYPSLDVPMKTNQSNVSYSSNGFLGGLLENVQHFHVPSRPRIVSRHLYGIMALVDESISPTPSPVLNRIGVYTVLLPSLLDPYPLTRTEESDFSTVTSSKSVTRSSTHSLRNTVNKENNLSYSFPYQGGSSSTQNTNGYYGGTTTTAHEDTNDPYRLQGTRIARINMWMEKRLERNWSKEAMVRYPHRADVVSRRLREQGRFS